MINTMNIRTFFAYHPDDADDIRLEKFAIFLVAGACCLAGVIWTIMYYLIFGWIFTTYLPILFTLLVGFSLLVSHVTRNHYYAIYTQIICIMFITALIQWSIGGVVDSGFVLAWSFLGPVCALLFFPIRQAVFWLFFYLVNLAITALFNDFFVQNSLELTDNIRLFFFIMNLSFSSVVVFLFAGYYVTAAKRERSKAETLLLNVLPKEIAPILKQNGKTISDYHESASVLFADMIGSTRLFSNLEPADAVDWLNEVFSMFDQLVAKYGLEKIRTIGDNYMVASGVPVSRPDHAHAIACLALDMAEGLKKLPERHGWKMEFRFGINSGPLVAGVIGTTKFHYDVWGDIVNTAARMESSGEAGRVQIGQGTYDLVKDSFHCSPRGVIDVKGKGTMQTWFLEGVRDD